MRVDAKTKAMPAKRPGLTSNDLYRQVKAMAILYAVRPSERFNEMELAAKFEVSRTPLREALNRLAAENILDFVPNRGFFVRELNRQSVCDLFELRRSLESSAVQLAVQRANGIDIDALRKFWKDAAKNKDAGAPAGELVARDEEFHLRLAGLSGNKEMVRALENVNARIHFVRWIDFEQRGHDTFAEHFQMLDAIEARDGEKCRALIEAHITCRMEEIAKVVDAGMVRLYSR